MLALLTLAAATAAAAAAGSGDPLAELSAPSPAPQKWLVELDETLKEEEGEEALLERFFEEKREPTGSACVAYVDEGGPNHELIQKLAEVMESQYGDPLHALALPLAAATDWQPGNERLVIHYRSWAKQLWKQEGLPPMDPKPTTFRKKAGQAWKEKDVRKWMLANAWPTINIRVLDKEGGDFPQGRYMGPSNPHGVALVFANLTGSKEFSTQYRLSKFLLPHAKRLGPKVRFSMVERSDKTEQIRRHFNVGIDGNGFQEELLLIDKVGWKSKDTEGANHYHGVPGKYLLRNLTQASVDEFFAAHAAGTLPTYWISRNESTHVKEVAVGLTGGTFESFVFDEDRKRGRLVAFFNDDPKEGCRNCVRCRAAWEDAAKQVSADKRFNGKVVLAAIDQSANEHPETSVPSRAGQPMVLWYPPGKREQRKRKKQTLYAFSEETVWTREWILERIDDLIADNDEL